MRRLGLALLLGGSIALTSGFVAGPTRGGNICRNPLCRSAFTAVSRHAVLSQLDFKPAVDVYAKFPKDTHTKHVQSDMPELLQPLSVKLSVNGPSPNGECRGGGAVYAARGGR